MSDIVEEFSYDNALSEAATEDLEDIVLKARAEGAVQEREACAQHSKTVIEMLEARFGPSGCSNLAAAVRDAIRAQGEAPKAACLACGMPGPQCHGGLEARGHCCERCSHAPKCSRNCDCHESNGVCGACVKGHCGGAPPDAPKCATCGGSGRPKSGFCFCRVAGETCLGDDGCVLSCPHCPPAVLTCRRCGGKQEVLKAGFHEPTDCLDLLWGCNKCTPLAGTRFEPCPDCAPKCRHCMDTGRICSLVSSETPGFACPYCAPKPDASELALNALRCVYAHYDGKSKSYGPWPDIRAAIAALEGK